ncbi:MAG TPA: hypothetical protein VN969_26270 [Streptosporangiaceae bacterium]|nr:hypothetical protein [Streptosporangiaceae bacterium]
MGGLRVRAAQNHRLGTAANLRLAALLGVTMALGIVVASGIQRTIDSAIPLTRGCPWYLPVLWSLTLAAVGLAWFARRPALAMIAALGVAALSFYPGQPDAFQAYTLLLVVLAALARGPVRPPRSWLWWLGAFPVWLLTGVPVLLPAIVLVLVLWIVVDARPAIALALLVAFFGVGHLSPSGLVFVAAGIMLAIPAVVRLRRQAVL